MKRKASALAEIEKLKKETLDSEIKKLKETPDSLYNNQLNRLDCITLDSLEKNGKKLPSDIPRLVYAEQIVRADLYRKIDNAFLSEYIFKKIKEDEERKLSSFINKGVELTNNSEKAIKFAALMFELELRRTDEFYQGRKLAQVIARGLDGQKINLVSVICGINEYDGKGGATIVSDIFAYLRNPRFEPVPLILNELMATKLLLEYYGIMADLSIYVADTEYTEVGRLGSITSEMLENLQKYVANIKTYLVGKDPAIQVNLISVLRENNLKYNEIKIRILENVTKWKDENFRREYYQKFEEDYERICESLGKKKIFPLKNLRAMSLEVARKRWAVYAAEGIAFSELNGNTIYISTERREKDTNYFIEKEARNNFPPIIYILKSSASWNQKHKEQSLKS